MLRGRPVCRGTLGLRVGVLERVRTGGRVGGVGGVVGERGLGAEGLAEGLARMDRVTFSTLKPTFCVVRE